MTKVICLTGGIGSGKSTVAQIFAEHNIPVYIADDAGKEVMETPEVIAAIKNEFGSEVFDADILDRKKLGAIVFADPAKLRLLNDIVHPAVRNHYQNWLARHRQHRFVVKEAAILFESGTDTDCDIVITVVAPLELRIERIQKRDNTDRQSILNRMSHQWSDEEKVARSHFVITNKTLTQTRQQALEILKKIEEL